jgi:hypothetical protein
MSGWTEGYLAEIGYTHGYYRDLCPAQLEYALLNRGVRTHWGPDFRYLELGFGQGVSLNVHAAARPGAFWGTDFNPSQAANARYLAQAGQTGAQALDLSFEQLGQLEDLPEFDLIVLHGIWSWVSDQNRAFILDLLSRKLAVGGVVFISYNCLPGWAQSVPLRHLMTLHAELAGSANDGIVQKIDHSIDFMQKLVDSGSLFFQTNPGAKQRLDGFQGLDRHYLAHEYFNKDWHPLPFSTVAEQLDQAKLSYVGSACLLEHIEPLQVSPPGLAMLKDIHHPILRESVRDFLTNRQFRKDMFVKGPVALSGEEQRHLLLQQRIVLLNPPDSINRVILGTGGQMELPELIYGPLLEILSQDEYRPKSLGEIERHPLWVGRPFQLLRDAVTLLVGTGDISPVQAESIVAEARPRCRSFNDSAQQRAVYQDGSFYLASPLTGSGVSLTRYDLLFVLALRHGNTTPDAIARFVWGILGAQGIVFRRGNDVLTTAEDNIQHIAGVVEGFLSTRLPVLLRLELIS